MNKEVTQKKEKALTFNLHSLESNTITKEEFAKLLKQSITGKRHNTNKK